MNLLEKNYKKYDFEEDYEVYSYGQKVFVFNLFTNLFIIFIGILLNEVFYTLVWIISFSSLRVHLGGYHCQSPMKCFVTTNTIYFISMMINEYCKQYFMYVFILFVIIFIYFCFKKSRPNKKANIIMIIEILCLCIKDIQMIVLLTLIENIVSYLIDKVS